MKEGKDILLHTQDTDQPFACLLMHEYNYISINEIQTNLFVDAWGCYMCQGNCWFNLTYWSMNLVDDDK